MKSEDFQCLLEVQRFYEFINDGNTYEIKAEKNSNGSYNYTFGEKYLPAQSFVSFNELMAEGKCGNHNLKDVVRDL